MNNPGYAPPELKAKLTGGYPGGHWIRYPGLFILPSASTGWLLH